MPIDGSETYSIARYLGIDALSDPTFTTDGTLLYLADTTGSPDVWRAAVDGDGDSAPERLTSHSQRVSFVSASPTRPMAIFGMDRGSDERDQLFRYDLRDGRETDLTRDPTAIHSWGGWAPDGDRFAYAANRREADLRGAYLDFSAWPLSCGSFGVKVDDRIVAQLLCHIARLDVSGCSPIVRYAHRLIFSTWPGKWLKNLFSEYRGDVEKI